MIFCLGRINKPTPTLPCQGGLMDFYIYKIPSSPPETKGNPAWLGKGDLGGLFLLFFAPCPRTGLTSFSPRRLGFFSCGAILLCALPRARVISVTFSSSPSFPLLQRGMTWLNVPLLCRRRGWGMRKILWMCRYGF